MSRPASAAPRRPAEEANVKVVVRCRCASQVSSRTALPVSPSAVAETSETDRPRSARICPEPRPRPTRRPLNAAEPSLQRRGRGDREPVAARDRRGHARAPASGPGASSHASAVSGGKPGATTGAVARRVQDVHVRRRVRPRRDAGGRVRARDRAHRRGDAGGVQLHGVRVRADGHGQDAHHGGDDASSA